MDSDDLENLVTGEEEKMRARKQKKKKKTASNESAEKIGIYTTAVARVIVPVDETGSERVFAHFESKFIFYVVVVVSLVGCIRSLRPLLEETVECY